MTTPSEDFPITEQLQADRIALHLTYDQLSPSTSLEQVSSPDAGANILFSGTTRSTFEDKSVARLSYVTYAPLALRTLGSIASTLLEKHGLTKVSISHRLGEVPVGEESILVAVSAPHRTAAWRGAEEILELIKEKVEIWKREEFEGEEKSQGVWKENRQRDGYGNIRGGST